MGGGRQSASSSCWGSPFCSDRCFLRANQRSAGQPAFGVINSSLPLRFLDVLFQWQGILFSWCCLSCCPDRYFCSANQRSTGQSTFGVMNSSLQFRFLGFLFQKKSGLWSWSGLPCCSGRCSPMVRRGANPCRCCCNGIPFRAEILQRSDLSTYNRGFP